MNLKYTISNENENVTYYKILVISQLEKTTLHKQRTEQQSLVNKNEKRKLMMSELEANFGVTNILYCSCGGRNNSTRQSS